MMNNKDLANNTPSVHKGIAVKRMHMIAAKQNWTSLNEEIRSVHSGAYGRLDWDLPAVTITTRFDTPSAGRYIHPVLIERLHRVRPQEFNLSQMTLSFMGQKLVFVSK